jgi:mono/diheme cytochrome c family protein
MKTHGHLMSSVVLLLGALAFASFVFAASPPDGKGSRKDSTPGSSNTALVQIADADSVRVEGEQRFHANCGRCHAAPQKFPPRVMATVVRHMRVRATITDADMRLILAYMTQ